MSPESPEVWLNRCLILIFFALSGFGKSGRNFDRGSS